MGKFLHHSSPCGAWLCGIVRLASWINPFLGQADNAMDNGSPENLQKLKEAGEDNIKRYDKELEALARKLVGVDDDELLNS